MTPNRRLATAILGVLLAAGLTACGGNKTVKGSFNDQANRSLRCMAHQTAAPSAPDRPGSSEDTERVLDYLHYYTVNGNKPYCDRKPATSLDRQWLAFYLAGGAQRSHITRALSGG